MKTNIPIEPDSLSEWVNSSTEKQLRFMVYGLLTAILRGKTQLPNVQSNQRGLSTLTYGILFASLVKEHCTENSHLDDWLTKMTDESTLHNILNFFQLTSEDFSNNYQ